MARKEGELTALDLRSLRVARRVAQRDLARAVGATLPELKRWERGLALPESHVLTKLAALLGVNSEHLIDAQRLFVETATPGEGYTTAIPEQFGLTARQITPPSGRFRVLDLFCGSGGFSYGFEQTGKFTVTAGIDLLPDRIATFRANHKAAATIVGDMREFPVARLGDAALGPDVVIGGPPCQGFSSIRPFRIPTEGDPRNTLFEHFALVVSQLRPRWFVLENVVGLLSHGSGTVLPAIIEAFRTAGYETDWRVVNAAQFGLPQNRERLIVVGNRDGRRFEWPTPTHMPEHRSMAGARAKRLYSDPLFYQHMVPAVTVMEAIHDLPRIAAGESADTYRTDVEPTAYERLMRNGTDRVTLHEATAHSEKMLEIIRHAGANRWALPEGMTTSGYSSCYSRLSPNEPSVTLTVNFVHPASNKCIHPYQDRALTPREGARLQGFRDDFVFEGTRSQIVKQIGNAVPPLLGQTIAEALAQQW